MAGSVLSDDFERADTAAGTLGVAPTGQAWLLTGAGAATAQVVGGRYVSGTPGTSQNVYAFQTFPPGHTVRRMRGTGVWDSQTNPQPLILASSKYPDTGFTDNLIHLFVTPTGITLQKFVATVFANVGATVVVNLTSDGATEHEIAWTLDDATVTVTYPGGSFVRTDPDFRRIAGRTSYHQVFDDGTTTARGSFEAAGASSVLRPRRGLLLPR